MQQYEIIDEFDARGRHIPNTTRKNPGAKEIRVARDQWDGESPLTVPWLEDAGRRLVTKTFYPPFRTVNREADYEKAYAIFESYERR
jgi:hypothetical protein